MEGKSESITNAEKSPQNVKDNEKSSSNKKDLTGNYSELPKLKCIKNNTADMIEQLPSKDIDKHLDNVLEAVKTLDITCAYAKCRAKTNLMGHDCDFCKEKYCFKHGLPEIHGCGEAVKNDERKKFLQQKPAKVIRQEQDLVKAKKKLNAKLKDMQVSRIAKTASSSGGGGGDKATRRKK